MTNDPYAVLGVSKGASQEEIKAAYRELVKKYHPDKYVGNPLADLAEEKLQEINEAYDLLTKGYSGAQTGSSGTAYGPGSSHYAGAQGSQTYGNYSAEGQYSYSSQSSSGDYFTVRQALDRNDLQTAHTILINMRDRTAEWYFLSGVLSYKMGYVPDALSYVQQAMGMDPNNQEYRSIYAQMTMTPSGNLYQRRSDQQGYGQNQSADDLCNILPFCFCMSPFCC